MVFAACLSSWSLSTERSLRSLQLKLKYLNGSFEIPSDKTFRIIFFVLERIWKTWYVSYSALLMLNIFTFLWIIFLKIPFTKPPELKHHPKPLPRPVIHTPNLHYRPSKIFNFENADNNLFLVSWLTAVLPKIMT